MFDCVDLCNIGCYSLFSNSFRIKYSFTFPTFSDIKKLFSSNTIK